MGRISKVLAIVAAIVLIAVCWRVYFRQGVPILAYHRVGDQAEIYSVSPADFERQMKYLADNGYTAISLKEMFTGFAGQQRLPAKPVVITFDDGYADNYWTALPILQKYGMKATVFIITGQVGQPDYLSWEQIAHMQRQGMEIGSHTVNHVTLTEIPPDERNHEIAAAKAALDANLDEAVEFLAYPFGQYDIALYPLLRQAGYKGACSGVIGLNQAGDDPYSLKRVNIPHPRLGLWEFRLRLLRANFY